MRYISRPPKKKAGFSWGRTVRRDGLVTWRLFRRDQRGAVHAAYVAFAEDELASTPPAAIAYRINLARHALRNKVDEIDLKLMGVIE
jgi:hypothetical protein